MKHPKLHLVILLAAMALLVGCATTPRHSTNVNERLIRAAEQGKTQVMLTLIRAGADINAQDAEGWTPYLAASSNGHFEAMRLLKGLGARTDVPEMEQFSYERRAEFNP